MIKNNYTKIIAELSLQLSATERNRNIITFAKVLSFVLIFFFVYKFSTTETITYLVVAIVMCVSLAVLSIYDYKIVKTIKFLNALINSYQTEIDYLNKKYDNLKTGDEYNDAMHDYATDLDIFGNESLFQAINRTISNGGSNALAKSLKTPILNSDDIANRYEATSELSKNIEWCHKFRAIGETNPISGVDECNIKAWQEQNPFFKTNKAKKIIYFSIFIFIILALLGFVNKIFFGCLIILFIIQLFSALLYARKVSKVHNMLGYFIGALGNYFFLIQHINNIELNSKLGVKIKDKLFKESNSLRAFKELENILEKLDGRGNILATVILNGIYMRDLHIVMRLDKWKENNTQHINEWVNSISEMDMLVSMANYRYNNPTHTEATFSQTKILSAKDMGHPLLRSTYMVSNDFEVNDLHNIFIITGANMAGKSTFLRAIGVNMILALSGNVVCAKEFVCKPMDIFSSMRTTDNLSKGTSYFHAELLRLKALIDKAEKGKPVFIILDEMLKGTNSIDKLNGSRRFLIRLLSLPISGVVATHDLALGELNEQYPNNFYNVCFEIDHSEKDIVYDYKLKNGVSKNMNASILLEQMGLV